VFISLLMVIAGLVLLIACEHRKPPPGKVSGTLEEMGPSGPRAVRAACPNETRARRVIGTAFGLASPRSDARPGRGTPMPIPVEVDPVLRLAYRDVHGGDDGRRDDAVRVVPAAVVEGRCHRFTEGWRSRSGLVYGCGPHSYRSGGPVRPPARDRRRAGRGMATAQAIDEDSPASTFSRPADPRQGLTPDRGRTFLEDLFAHPADVKGGQRRVIVPLRSRTARCVLYFDTTPRLASALVLPTVTVLPTLGIPPWPGVTRRPIGRRSGCRHERDTRPSSPGEYPIGKRLQTRRISKR
jgi:hypothetical protein